MASFVLASFVYTYWESDYEEKPALPGPSSCPRIVFGSHLSSEEPGSAVTVQGIDVSIDTEATTGIICPPLILTSSSRMAIGQRVGSISQSGWTTL